MLHRPLVIAGLGVLYVALSAVVYTDFPNQPTHNQVSNLEKQGLALWRQHNCQACHQLYGFGGFHGPDLTNLVNDTRLDEEFSSILDTGLGRMPAFHLAAGEQHALLAYLRMMDRSGQSQPTPLATRRPVDRVDHFNILTTAWEERNDHVLQNDLRKGCEVWSEFSCGSCHHPFAIGKLRAKDLSVRTVDRSSSAIGDILSRGRGRMPVYLTEDEDVKVLSGYLRWVHDNRSELVEINKHVLDLEHPSWSALSWFEYR